MTQRPQYLTQVLEKIGAPLMKAIAAATQAGQSNLQDDAKIMAELLSKTVRTSIEIGKMMDLSALPDHGDSVRVALAGIASGIVAEQFRRHGASPGENDIKRIVSALQAVITFSENFTPSPENTARLSLLEAQGQTVDSHQVSVQYLQALTPVVNAIGTFSFGYPEQKLILDVSSRLLQKTSAIAAALSNMNDDARKKAELGILRAVAQIYSAAHDAETQRLMALNEDQRAQYLGGGQSLSIDTVWKVFEERTALLESIARNVVSVNIDSGHVESGSGGAQPTPPLQTAPEPAEQPQNPPAAAPGGFNPMSSFSKSPPDQAQTGPKPASQQGQNPMSFFKPSGKNGDET